jgi:Domain of unknown function (DUF4091)
MSSRRRVICLAFSLGCMAGACGKGPPVQVLGDSTRLAGGLPSPATSPFFDGNQVHLRGARGETLGLEVRVADGHARTVSLELSGRMAVSAFAVGSLEVTAPSTDLYGTSTGRGRYPDVLTPIQGGVRTTELAFFDVAIPENTEEGRYTGTLRVERLAVPVTLDVSRARIRLEQAPLVWVFYAPRELARVHGVPDDDSPAELAIEAKYFELFRAHGALLASDLPPARTAARRGFMRDVKYWPVAVDTSSDDAIARDTRAFVDAFRGTGVTPFTIPIDEPKTPAQKQRARHIADVIGAAGGGRPALLRAVTDRPDPIYGDAIDVYFSPEDFPAVAAQRRATGERFWTYNGRPPGAGSMILDTEGTALRTWGWIAEKYGIDLWYAWEGLYFSDRYNDRAPTDTLRDPITFDERTRGGTDFGNGDGVLAYPGALPSLRLKALRRGLEDRLLLRELERCGGSEAARHLVDTMVPRALGEAGKNPSWSLSEPAWENARQELLTDIEAACR